MLRYQFYYMFKNNIKHSSRSVEITLGITSAAALWLPFQPIWMPFLLLRTEHWMNLMGEVFSTSKKSHFSINHQLTCWVLHMKLLSQFFSHSLLSILCKWFMRCVFLYTWVCSNSTKDYIKYLCGLDKIHLLCEWITYKALPQLDWISLFWLCFCKVPQTFLLFQAT